MTENSTFSLTIDLRPGGKEEVFDSKESFQKWLDIEKSFWNWGAALGNRNHDVINVLNGVNSRIIGIQNCFINAKNRENDPQNLRQYINELSDTLKEYYCKNTHLLHSSTPAAKFVNDIKEKEPVRAAYVLKYFLERNFDSNNKNQVEGMFAALSFEFSVTKNVAKAEKISLEELREAWQNNYNQSKKMFDETVAACNETLQAIKSQKDGETTTFNQMLHKSSIEYHELVEETKKHFKQIEELYQKNLALHSSISYWEEKSEDHFKLVKSFSLGVVATFIIVSLGLFFTVREFVGDDTLQNVQLWKITLILLVATIGVWATRVLVRLLLSNIHLGSEAKERRTMLLTYLALLQEGKLPEGDVRHLILQALFRPATTGIVKDDGVPPFMAEWLKRATGND
jgi:hypothetical protein